MSKKNVVEMLSVISNEEFDNMSKEELVELVSMLRKKSGIGVKERVLESLMCGSWVDNDKLVELSAGRSKNNVASYVSYLRNDGYVILSEKNSRKLIGKVEGGKKYKLEGGEFVEGDIVISY